jgi:anti-sigma B factor antagonist
VSGEVDIYTAPKLRERLVELIDGGSRAVVVNLEGVSFMDSTGLGSLVAGLKRMSDQGGRLTLVCTREPVLKVLQITGLDRVFAVHDTVEAATG